MESPLGRECQLPQMYFQHKLVNFRMNSNSLHLLEYNNINTHDLKTCTRNVRYLNWKSVAGLLFEVVLRLKADIRCPNIALDATNAEMRRSLLQVLQWPFKGKKIRLLRHINRKILSPFQYYRTKLCQNFSLENFRGRHR